MLGREKSDGNFLKAKFLWILILVTEKCKALPGWESRDKILDSLVSTYLSSLIAGSTFY